jgi:hypothetical protein
MYRLGVMESRQVYEEVQVALVVSLTGRRRRRMMVTIKGFSLGRTSAWGSYYGGRQTGSISQLNPKRTLLDLNVL